MYKCSECGCEFKTKPDYCDCGNDSFEEIVSDENFNTTNTREYNSILKKNLPSIIFLIFCIILSFIILFFIGNPKDNPIQNEVIKTPENIKVADINDIWNDEKPKQPVIQKPKNDPVISQAKIDNTQPKIETPKKPVIQTPKINKPIQQPIQKPVTQKPATQKPITQKVQKPVQKPTQKPVSSNQQVKTTSNPKSQQVQKPTQTPKTNPIYKPAQNSQQKPQQQSQQSQTQPKTQTQQQTQTQNTQSQNIQTQKVQTQSTKTVNAEELKQYKKALRSKIASNIDFLSVAGDGKCVLSFSISQSGVLLNRKFVSQSQNTSLNDAVYSAMLQVSSFKAPPAGYRNETMKLTVQISGSNFSVILD